MNTINNNTNTTLLVVADRGYVAEVALAGAGLNWHRTATLYRGGEVIADSPCWWTEDAPAQNAAIVAAARPGDSLVVCFFGGFEKTSCYVVASPMGERRVKRGYCAPLSSNPLADPLEWNNNNRHLRARWLREDRAKERAARLAEVEAQCAANRAALKAAAKQRQFSDR